MKQRTASIASSLLAASTMVVPAVYSYAQPAPTTKPTTVFPSQLLTNGAVWNAATGSGTFQIVYASIGVGPPAVLVQLDQGTGVSAGAITFQVTYDGINWQTISATQVVDPTSTSLANISLPYTLVAAANKAFLLLTRGAQGLRIYVSTTTAGGAVTPYWTLLSTGNVTELNPNSLTAPYGATFPTTGNPVGSDATNAEPTLTTTGFHTPPDMDLAGRQTINIFGKHEQWVRGAASASGTAGTTIISAQGSGIFIYATNVECFRSDAGTTASFVTLSDTASTIIGLPNSGGGGGNNVPFLVPLKVAANTALTFTSSGSLSTVYCNAQGFTSKE